MDQQATPTTNSVRALFTRARANDGVRLDLDGGNWMLVRGIDADVVQQAVTDHARAKVSAKAERVAREKAGEKVEAAIDEADVVYDDPTVVASMVAGWSYDEPCTPEIVKEVLLEAPYLRVQIVNLAFERARFLPQAATPSSSTPNTSSP